MDYTVKVRNPSKVRYTHGKSQCQARIHPLLAGLPLCKYWSLQGKEAVHSTPSAKVRRFIWVQVMKGGMKRGNMIRNEVHTMRQWYLEEPVTNRRKIRAAPFSRARPAAPPGGVQWCELPSGAFLTGLCWASGTSRFIVVSLVYHQAEL